MSTPVVMATPQMDNMSRYSSPDELLPFPEKIANPPSPPGEELQESEEESNNKSPSSTRSSSFITLLQACERPQCADKDAGNKSVDHYKSRLPPWRFALRNMLLPLIRWETPYLARLQIVSRNPVLDIYFALSANLGTHTFYVVMLPTSYWFGFSELGRDLTFILAFGVYITGFLKDLLCLPRPLSPPLHRITMSGSAALEYGFPSTHTANAVGVGLLVFYSLLRDRAEYAPQNYLLLQALNVVYVVSIVAGRVYCGMHGFLDVVFGSIIGAVLWWMRFAFAPQMDALFIGDGRWTSLAVPFILMLVRIHPEPADNCPCFDDGVAFLGVMLGVWSGQWLFSKSGIAGPCLACIPYDYQTSGAIGSVLRFIFGVGLIVTWRHHMKRILHEYLPPLFRFVEKIGLTMPRKYFTPASQYKDVPTSIPDITLFETNEITSMFSKAGRARSDSVGPQSTADVYETLAYRDYQKEKAAKARAQAVDEHTPLNSINSVNYRGHKDVEVSVLSSGSNLQPRANIEDGTVDPWEEDLMLTVVIPRVKYDVEVVTKLVVYAGIGAITTALCGVLFVRFGI
jgi:membrane-associated phospholipid phosphatase